MDTRFALRDFNGNPLEYFFVEIVPVDSTQVSTVTDPSHHIVVMDASGSMYYDIDPMKSTIEKVWTLEEYKDSEQYVSLVSYASNGDLIVHFDHVQVKDILAPGSRYLQEIRGMRTRGATCLSQGLAKARTLVRPDELTAITLHSDGYANDRSPTDERNQIDRIVSEFAGMGNVYVNTVSYRYGDYNLLNGISNSLSGKCIQAGSSKEVFDALHDTTALLNGQRSPALFQSIGNADYQVFFSRKDRKILGSNKDLSVKGLSSDADKVIFRYRKVTEAQYNGSSLPEGGFAEVLSYARAQLSEGQINRAKYAVVASKNQTLLKRHAKSLTGVQIASFCHDVEGYLFDMWACQFSLTYGLDTTQAPVVQIISVLEQYKSGFRVSISKLNNSYKRRTVPRMVGSRDKTTGEVTLPSVDTESVLSGDYVSVSGFDFNRNTATINMQTISPIRLLMRDTRTPITTVKGIDVSHLTDFRKYTVIGDGDLNLDSLSILISDKRLYSELEKLGLVTGGFDPGTEYQIKLSDRPIIRYDGQFTPTDVSGFDSLVRLKVLESILKALLSDNSVAYTDEQVAALKDVYLSPSLYVNLPTCNSYVNLKDEQTAGRIDTRISINVDIGSTSLLNLSKLKSANAYLDRRFTVTIDGVVQEKATWDMFWIDGAVFAEKKLSARTKLDTVDSIMYPIFSDLLGFTSNNVIETILESTSQGLDSSQIALFREAGKRDLTSKDKAVEVFTAVQRAVKNEMEYIYDLWSQTVFFIGASGLIPEGLGATPISKELLESRYPDLKISKDESEATFYRIGPDTLLSIYRVEEYVRIER